MIGPPPPPHERQRMDHSTTTIFNLTPKASLQPERSEAPVFVRMPLRLCAHGRAKRLFSRAYGVVSWFRTIPIIFTLSRGLVATGDRACNHIF